MGDGEQLEAEAHAFRALLKNVEPYRAIYSGRAARNSASSLTLKWRRSGVSTTGGARHHAPQADEGHVVCFFQLCQAAALGTHVIGKKDSDPFNVSTARMPAYGRSLAIAGLAEAAGEQFDDTAGKLDLKVAAPNSARACATELTMAELAPAHAPRVGRVFVSCGRDAAEFAERIRVTLDFADIESRRLQTESGVSIIHPARQR